jgi:hypothetical protein
VSVAASTVIITASTVIITAIIVITASTVIITASTVIITEPRKYEYDYSYFFLFIRGWVLGQCCGTNGGIVLASAPDINVTQNQPILPDRRQTNLSVAFAHVPIRYKL